MLSITKVWHLSQSVVFEMDPAPHVDDQALTRGEYETQLFGFSSRTLFVHLKDCLNEIFNNVATNLQDTLIRKRGSDANEAKSATNLLMRKCECVLQAHSDDLQIGCDFNFGIPDVVLLPEDSAQKVQYSAEEAQNLESELDRLTTRLTRAKAMRCHLAHELEEFEKLKPMIEKLQNPRLEIVNDLYKKQVKLQQKLKKLSNVSKSISSVTSQTEMNEPNFPHTFVREKFYRSPPE